MFTTGNECLQNTWQKYARGVLTKNCLENLRKLRMILPSKWQHKFLYRVVSPGYESLVTPTLGCFGVLERKQRDIGDREIKTQYAGDVR